jgi:hypothetical protein
MIDEWCKEAPKELDFNHEAGIFLAQVLTNIAICFSARFSMFCPSL